MTETLNLTSNMAVLNAHMHATEAVASNIAGTARAICGVEVIGWVRQPAELLPQYRTVTCPSCIDALAR